MNAHHDPRYVGHRHPKAILRATREGENFGSFTENDRAALLRAVADEESAAGMRPGLVVVFDVEPPK